MVPLDHLVKKVKSEMGIWYLSRLDIIVHEVSTWCSNNTPDLTKMLLNQISANHAILCIPHREIVKQILIVIWFPNFLVEP